jgi:hypothetical protein
VKKHEAVETESVRGSTRRCERNDQDEETPEYQRSLHENTDGELSAATADSETALF